MQGWKSECKFFSGYNGAFKNIEVKAFFFAAK